MGGLDEPIKRPRGRPPKVRVEPIMSPEISQSFAREVMELPRDVEGVFDAPTDEQLADWVEEAEQDAPLTLPQIIALDRDHDGQPGGSWPFASLTENETRGLVAEFFEAYESQVETKRVDTFNRVWSFRHEAIHSQDTMVLSVKRGPVVAERHIPASMARFKDIADVLSELDAETAR